MDFSSLESKYLNQLKETDDVIRVHTVGEQSWKGRLLALMVITDLYQGEHTYGSRRQTRNRNLEIQKQHHPQNTKYQELKLCAARDLP